MCILAGKKIEPFLSLANGAIASITLTACNASLRGCPTKIVSANSSSATAFPRHVETNLKKGIYDIRF